MTIHENQEKDQARETACVYFWHMADLSQRKLIQHLKPEAQKSRQAGGKFVWELDEFQLVKHDRLAEQSPRVCLQFCRMVWASTCCAWLGCTAIIVRPASLVCPMDARMWLFMCLRAETLLSCPAYTRTLCAYLFLSPLVGHRELNTGDRV